MTLDILICTLDKGIVRVADIMQPHRHDVRYIVAFQYSDERYLELIPDELNSRPDVLVIKTRGKGLSANRNVALSHSSSDLLMFADDDVRFLPDSSDKIIDTFSSAPTLDIAFFQAETYTGKPLREYADYEMNLSATNARNHTISAIEMVCRRTSVQGRLAFDVRFGLGAPVLTCYEEDIWLADANRLSLNIIYYPCRIVQTSTLLKRLMISTNIGVQRSFGAKMYYIYGNKAYVICMRVALRIASHSQAKTFALMKNFNAGISYLKKTPKS